MLCRIFDLVDFLGTELAHLAQGIAKPQVASGQFLAGGDQRAGANDGMRVDDGTVHDGGTHADQAVVHQPAGMQGDAMANGDLVAYLQIMAAGAVGAVMGDMQHAMILDVGVAADPDFVHIPADHGKRPDRTVLTDDHVTDDQGRVIDPGIGMGIGQLVFKFSDRHVVKYRMPHRNRQGFYATKQGKRILTSRPVQVVDIQTS